MTDEQPIRSNVHGFEDVAALWSRVLGAADSATLGPAVEICLERLGTFTEVDVAYVTLVDDTEHVSDDWNWVRPGHTVEPPPLGSALSDTFGSTMEFFRLGHTIPVTDVDAIELAPSERRVASRNAIRALLLVPMRLSETLLGLVGLGVFDRPRQWDDSCIHQAEVLAQLLTGAVVRHRQRGALAAATVRARRIAEFLPDGLLVLDMTGHISWASPSLARMAGLPADQLEGRSVGSLVHPDDRRTYLGAAEQAAGGHPDTVTLRVQSAEDGWRWAEVSWQVVSEPESGVPDEIVVSVRDVQQRYLEAQELIRRSEQDVVTGLANRTALELTLQGLARQDVPVVLAFCDIDDFKAVNDRLGHDQGDRVLRAVGQALRSTVRPTDTVARIGGDEFMVVATDLEPLGDVVAWGERLVATVRARSEPAEGLPPVTISVGVCGPAPARSIDGIRQAADEAMYRAKGRGRDRCEHVGWPPDPG